MSRVLAFSISLLAVFVLAACSRGPDEAALKSEVQGRIDKTLFVSTLRQFGKSQDPREAVA